MAIVDFGSLDGSGGVAGVAAIVAPIDPFIGPALFRLCYRPITGGMVSQFDLVFRFGHVSATIGLIMNFMIAIGLLVIIDDVMRHNIDFEM
ncbi:hypothetical protein OKA04_16550 [Luteolibacter flavescens]|uniref:Uncharacterized protein n=1 Tax=Luteolibacter flavescens TaxID=1859460 RepID=A0ABT3FS02_9BACT|nr:hypothetical protein [Luteolibacter flavescens]